MFRESVGIAGAGSGRCLCFSSRQGAICAPAVVFVRTGIFTLRDDRKDVCPIHCRVLSDALSKRLNTCKYLFLLKIKAAIGLGFVALR